MYFCKYKHALGIPGKGVHSIRIKNIAIVDVLLSILMAYFLSTYIFKKTHFLFVLGFVFILGIILHRLFCVKTTIDKLLFGK
tara:strand:- start:329 stop:574 length:246 start_codon:yes stop_codon:yes gene_type:complete